MQNTGKKSLTKNSKSYAENDYFENVEEMKEVLGDRYEYAVAKAQDLLIEKSKCIPGVLRDTVIDEYGQTRVITKYGLKKSGTVDVDISDHRRIERNYNRMSGTYALAVILIFIGLGLTVFNIIKFLS